MAEILTPQAQLVEATLTTPCNQPRLSENSPIRHEKWQDSLKSALRSSRQLLDAVELPYELGSVVAEEEFPVFAPLEYVSRMRKGDPHDPLLLQVLGSPLETASPNGLDDPVGDSMVELIPGLLKKYHRRVLLITSGACAVHCRYCFRRHYPYQSAPKGIEGWQAAIQAIADDDSIDEVILSGGDPLSVTDSGLRGLTEALNNIPHLRRIRIHTRFPVVIPSRVCDQLLEWVHQSRCAIYFVLHINHSAEIDAKVQAALSKLRHAGAVLLNQSVLLAGINDSFMAQRDLCLSLVDNQVLPYYLHQLDRVRGATHFEVMDETALEIIAALRRDLPGYAVPQLVREVAGQPHKSPVLP